MALEILELHHHSVRTGPTQEDADQAVSFYRNVLGLGTDDGRNIPAVPGYWVDVGGKAQVHLMGMEGESQFSQGPGKDPTLPHVAFAVPDINETKAELERMGVDYWILEGVSGPDFLQVYINDPAGNLIELHQIGTCRCKAVDR